MEDTHRSIFGTWSSGCKKIPIVCVNEDLCAACHVIGLSSCFVALWRIVYSSSTNGKC